MAEGTRLPDEGMDDPSTQDGLASFAVWARTTRFGEEDDADLAENNVVLRGID
ncbi:hypothetical protein [Actinophytocola sediminis]